MAQVRHMGTGGREVEHTQATHGIKGALVGEDGAPRIGIRLRELALAWTVIASLASGKVLCGGQQTLSIQCRGGNLSGKRFELGAAENWAGAPLPRFSTMRDAHRPVRFLRVDRPSPSPGVSEMRGPLRRSSPAEEAFLLGSVLGDGLRATDLPREPAGHRSLPPIRDRETLSPGVSRHGGAQPQVIEFPD